MINVQAITWVICVLSLCCTTSCSQDDQQERVNQDVGNQRVGSSKFQPRAIEYNAEYWKNKIIEITEYIDKPIPGNSERTGQNSFKMEVAPWTLTFNEGKGGEISTINFGRIFDTNNERIAALKGIYDAVDELGWIYETELSSMEIYLRNNLILGLMSTNRDIDGAIAFTLTVSKREEA